MSGGQGELCEGWFEEFEGVQSKLERERERESKIEKKPLSQNNETHPSCKSFFSPADVSPSGSRKKNPLGASILPEPLQQP